ncbi:MAG TPA: hypothetical protein ENJ00_06570 [Phycisphaerales bacterium]|nr:hypothetical protein [Phycisphaerales bacterium]
MNNPRLGQTVARGATAMVGVTLLAKVLASAGQFVLAFYLVESDFGQWALALSLADMFGLVNKLGLREILTNRQKHVDQWMNPAIWAATLGGVMTLLILVAMAPWSPKLFHSASPGFPPLLIIAGVGVATSGLNEVFQARLALDFRFGLIAKVTAAEGFVRIVAQVILSMLGMGALGLVLVRSLTWTAQAITLGLFVRPKIRRRPEWNRFREASRDTKNIFLTRVAEVGIRRGDVVVLGMFAPDSVVGVYFFAFGLSTQVIMLLAQSLTGALSAGLSKLQDDVPRMRDAFLSVVRLVSFVGVPLLVVESATASPVLRMIYAEKWAEAIVPLQILSISACFSIAGWNNAAVFTARGLFRRQLVFKIVASTVYLTTMLVSAWFGGILAVAWATLGFRICFLPAQVVVATGGGWRAMVESILAVLRPLSVAGTGALLAIWFTRLVDPQLVQLADFAGEQSARAVEFERFVLIGSFTLLWYWVGSRMLLRRSYREFAARVRTILPARIAKQIPDWLL